MSQKESTIVTIFGHQYRIAADAPDARHVEVVAALLDSRMRRIAASTRRKVALEIAIQAAMEIADEVLKARDKRDQLLTGVDEHLSRFTRKLEDGASTSDLLTGGDDSASAPRF
jgi:cell division protein ZapA (FtsZ GTPase activity inhibitor)